MNLDPPAQVKVLRIRSNKREDEYWTKKGPYQNQAVLVRPDSYIEAIGPLDQTQTLLERFLV